ADGENLSPPLTWRDPPANTRSFALLVEDPDAPRGVFRHWAVYNIDPSQRSLREGLKANEAAQAINDFGHANYEGSKSPKGSGPHHYHFRLAALDTPLIDASPRDSAQQAWRKIEPHILAEADLVGLYQTR